MMPSEERDAVRDVQIFEGSICRQEDEAQPLLSEAKWETDNHAGPTFRRGQSEYPNVSLSSWINLR